MCNLKRFEMRDWTLFESLVNFFFIPFRKYANNFILFFIGIFKDIIFPNANVAFHLHTYSQYTPSQSVSGIAYCTCNIDFDMELLYASL